MTDVRNTFVAATDRGIPLKFIADPDAGTVRYYDRRYAGKPGFTEHGQDCGPAFPLDAFDPDATNGIRGWHEADDWTLDARTVRLVGAWLHMSGFTEPADR